MRRLRIVAPIQLAMAMPELASTPAQRWSALPDAARTTALSVLARMIADGVVEAEVADAGEH